MAPTPEDRRILLALPHAAHVAYAAGHTADIWRYHRPANDGRSISQRVREAIAAVHHHRWQADQTAVY